MDRTRHKSKGEGPAIDKLTARQTRAILALVQSPTVEDAAKQANVGRSSVYLWMRQPDFRAKLVEARAELFRDGLDALRAATLKAVAVLGALMISRNENTRRLAAQAILALGLRAHEAVVVEDRLRHLEKIIDDNRGRLG